VDALGDHLLAGAGLTRDEHVDVPRRDELHEAF